MDTKERIAIIGFMGSGKTTLGKELAEKIGYKFVDLDALIEKTCGMKIKEIFKTHGEKRFREYETVHLKKLAQEKKILVSCGGGIVENRENLQILDENFFVVYLKVPFELCLERIRDDTERPLVSLGSDKLLEIYRRREPLYTQIANFIYTQDCQINDLVELFKADERI